MMATYPWRLDQRRSATEEHIDMEASEQVDPEEATIQALRPIHIDDGVVHRPGHEWTPTVHSFLRHLRFKGLDCAPEPLAIDGETERLGFIAGDAGGDGWYHQHTDAGLQSAARLLRRIHDASLDWNPPPGAVWGSPPVDGDDQVFCHGDPGPWNFVWRDNEAVGLIDWDFLHPAPRIDDVAYALRWFAPARSDEHALDWHHFPEVPDRKARIAAFLDAYGALPEFDVVEAIASRAEATMAVELSLAQRGIEPQRTWVAEGSQEAEAQEVAWVRGHAHLLT
jgi:hypothetical protein